MVLHGAHDVRVIALDLAVKNIKHDRYCIFLKASRCQILTKTIRTREKLADRVNRLARRLAQQVALVCGRFKVGAHWSYVLSKVCVRR
jgi:hypothetical protein